MTIDEKILALAKAIDALRDDANLDCDYPPFSEINDIIWKAKEDPVAVKGFEKPTEQEATYCKHGCRRDGLGRVFCEPCDVPAGMY